MKEYPSILSSNGNNFTEFKSYVFDKLDGSNLRFEWSKKRGWFKFGTRTRLFDETDETFGCAIPLFYDTLSEPLAKIAKDSRWEHLIVYSEFWGENSFAGTHYPEDEKHLTIFDVAVNKKGIMGPKEFLNTFDNLPIASYLGQFNWTRGFVETVRRNELDGITFEGVVGKAGEGHKLLMRKAKTQIWIDAVKTKYGEDKAKELI
jgi:hypothetical protein